MRQRQATEAPAVKLLLTMEEAAQALSLGRNTLYKLVLSGAIHSVKIGRTRRVPLVALEQYIARQIEQN